MPPRRAVLMGGAAASAAPGIVLAQAPAGAPPPAAGPRAFSVSTPDGTTIRAYEHGNPQGPAILLIHGFMQCALSWDRQVNDPALLREFRMVTMDLRGHGMSDKPAGDAFYKPAKPWADDVAAVIAAAALQKPVLVGWSYGGRVMGDYLSVHGHGAIGGLNWVGATSSAADPTRFGRGGRFSAAATGGSDDTATAIRSTVSFLRECFEIQPSASDFETMLAFNMMVPRHVRLAALGRPADYAAAFAALDLPVLVTHGVKDKLVDISMGRFTAGAIRGARLSEYENIGHAPFWEDAPRFNRELAELARSARR